jgi:hypothetical protein
MPIKLGGRRGAGVVVVDQTILLAGGTEPTEGSPYAYVTEKVDTIYEYTPATGKWNQLKWKLPKKVSEPDLAYNSSTGVLVMLDLQYNLYSLTKPFESSEWMLLSDTVHPGSYLCF